MQVGDTYISFIKGDITKQHVDAIVNAANPALAVGGGVDGAIHRAGGPAINEDTRRNYPQGCPTGSAVISTAGTLPAKWVIHAVGPVWRGGNDGEADKLTGAYRRALELASEAGAESIAFPAISTGIYGYPADRAAAVAINTARDFLENNVTTLKEVRFVLFDDASLLVFTNTLSG